VAYPFPENLPITFELCCSQRNKHGWKRYKLNAVYRLASYMHSYDEFSVVWRCKSYSVGLASKRFLIRFVVALFHPRFVLRQMPLYTRMLLFHFCLFFFRNPWSINSHRAYSILSGALGYSVSPVYGVNPPLLPVTTRTKIRSYG